jgi:hypothetical protein
VPARWWDLARHCRSLALANAVLLGVAGCANTVPSTIEGTLGSPSAGASEPNTPPSVTPTSRPAATAAACLPTDQDRYVYHPARLQVLAACIRVTGTVAFIRSEADGDLHLGLALDTLYAHLVVAANSGVERGDLVIEPVCELRVTQADAIATCAADRDPLRGLPTLGEHVWMEGRYVADLDHGGWRELHPLYRWGALP